MKPAPSAIALTFLVLLSCGGTEQLEMTASVRLERAHVVGAFDAGEKGKVVIVLPPDAAAGDRISCIVSVSETRSDMSVPPSEDGRYSSYSLAVLGETTPLRDGVLSFLVPEGHASVRLELVDPRGRVLTGLDYPVSPDSSTKPAPDRLGLRRLRGLLFVEGPFDGRLGNTKVMLDGRPLDVWMESPRGLMVAVQGDQPPRAQLSVIEGETLLETWLPNIVVTAEPEWVDVTAGERVSVRVQACGLAAVAAEDSPRFFLSSELAGVSDTRESVPLPFRRGEEDCSDWTVDVTAAADGELVLSPWVHWR